MRNNRGLAAALILAACVHVPPRPIDPAESARKLEQRSLADAQAFVAEHSGAAGPIERWDLDALTLAAFYFHPELDVARAEAAVARAAMVTAGERPDPTINLAIEHKSEPKPWITVLGFDVPIETAGKRGLRRRHSRSSSAVGAVGNGGRMGVRFPRLPQRPRLACSTTSGRLSAASLRVRERFRNLAVESRTVCFGPARCCNSLILSMLARNGSWSFNPQILRDNL